MTVLAVGIVLLFVFASGFACGALYAMHQEGTL